MDSLDFGNELQTIQNNQQDTYYQQYCRLFLANMALTSQMKDLIAQKNHLKQRLSRYEDQQCYNSFEKNDKNKRFRRNANEINRFYKCAITSCSKSYGSEGSLNQHYKLKHPEIYAALPSVQSGVYVKFSQYSYENQFQHDSKVEKSISSFRNNFEHSQNKQNKQNRCSNILQNMDLNSNNQKYNILTFEKRQETTLEDNKVKKSSRSKKH